MNINPKEGSIDQPLALGGFPWKRGVFMLNLEYIEYPWGVFQLDGRMIVASKSTIKITR